MKIALVTDAWHPQVNGVVRTLSELTKRLDRRGHCVTLIEPSKFRTIPAPTYPEIRLAIRCANAVGEMLESANADSIHIGTEGPLGHAARAWCLRNGRRFSSSFHTRFPDYVAVRTGIPASWLWAVMRRFHNRAERTFVCTPSLQRELQARGIRSTYVWPLGVDLAQFGRNVMPHPKMADLPRPVMLNVGRVAVEKNIEAFLECRTKGSKVVVGDGPALVGLRRRHPSVLFLGALHGDELASAYSAADVFVFPSRTDTFGLVNIEALACGTPVAAFPVHGPIDILGEDGFGVHGGSVRIGAVDQDLKAAITSALLGDRAAAAEEAAYYSWDNCTDNFLDGLVPARSPAAGRAA